MCPFAKRIDDVQKRQMELGREVADLRNNQTDHTQKINEMTGEFNQKLNELNSISLCHLLRLLYHGFSQRC